MSVAKRQESQNTITMKHLARSRLMGLFSANSRHECMMGIIPKCQRDLTLLTHPRIGAIGGDHQVERAVLAPVFERLQADGDSQAMLGWLAERFPDLSADALQERLAQVLFAAAVWGRLHGQA